MIAGSEGAGRVVRDEQCPDGQSVGETLRERDEVRAHAQLLEREERARPPDPGLHLVEAEERRELCGRCDELAVERHDAALAEDRLEEDQAHLVVDGRDQRVDVVRRNEADAGYERGERLALRRLPRHRQRAERPPVEPTFERHDAGLARRLARVLDRRLDRLGARVAEEGLRTSEAIGERRRELLGGLGAVQVRDVPQPFELRLRSRERSGMAVTQRHDGDPAAEVEVLTPVGVPDAAAVAAHDREIGARVRRQKPLEPRRLVSSSRDHRRLADLGAEARPRGLHRRHELRARCRRRMCRSR